MLRLRSTEVLVSLRSHRPDVFREHVDIQELNMTSISRRDFLKLGGTALLASIGISAGKYVPLHDEPNFTAPFIWNGTRKFKRMAFTYDDCYLLNKMQDLEVLLNEFPDFKVTFFPVGIKLLDLEQQDPGIWKRLVDNGHEIGYHTFDHVNLGVMSPATALMDYDKWYGALTQVLGAEHKVRFIRPPYDVISYTLDVLCQERGLVSALFSIGGGGEPDVVVRAIQEGKGGDIVQMHIRTQDYNSSVIAYPWLKANNWELVTLSKLYDDYLREQVNSDGCDVNAGVSLTRTCVE
ncbi:MAG: polysaccharide deacetylase family protein [Anaerolineales bacterium]|nr:polysaccharide deacetylase family protein [Anaerolineales bacterium]